VIEIGIFQKALATKLGKTANSSHPFEVIQDKIVFLRFWKMILHSLIALTKVQKLSSSNTISDASLATSVHIFHIATQILAILRAGASLIPSQVTATIFALALSKETILSLSSGDALQKITRLCPKSSKSCISLFFLISSHITTNGSS